MVKVVVDEGDQGPEHEAKERRRAAIAEALDAVRHGPRIAISEHMSVPLRLLGNIQDARD